MKTLDLQPIRSSHSVDHSSSLSGLRSVLCGPVLVVSSELHKFCTNFARLAEAMERMRAAVFFSGEGGRA